MRDRRAQVLLVLAFLLWPALGGAATCAGTGSVVLVVDNRSTQTDLLVTFEGSLLDADATCDGAGASTYAAQASCHGQGLVRCTTVEGLRPGAWAHRLRVQVSGSDEQAQSQRAVALGGAGVSNVVAWTVYPKTFVLQEADGASLRQNLELAQAYTAANPSKSALITFDSAVFPGADDPRTIVVGHHVVPPNTSVCDVFPPCPDGRDSTICFTGSRVTVDAVDQLGRSGGVVISPGPCTRSLLRMYGSDNVLRGLELRGTTALDPPLDTIAITGSSARRNRLEAVTVVGPGRGDAISIDTNAGTDQNGKTGENVVRDSIVVGAEDKGIKVTSGAHALIAESCVHDNRNGGIQSTLGGHVTAVRNVIQHNILGEAQNGLLVGVPNDTGSLNTLVTDGNIVRFAGNRGISVVNSAQAFLNHDFVAENQFAGVRVEATQPSIQPQAMFRGVGFVCNRKAVLGACIGQPGVVCGKHADCMSGFCGLLPPPAGVGAAIASCGAPGCFAPAVDLGLPGSPGRNAFSRNANPGGINLSNALAGDPPPSIVARGNQWEHCGTDPMCDTAAVQLGDIAPSDSVEIGMPTGPAGGPPPILTLVWPPRPRKGDLVRVYNASADGLGGPFNAVDGAACTVGGQGPDGTPLGIPGDPCSADNPAVVAQNHSSPRGNSVYITIADGTPNGELLAPDVHAVTPTMLAFRMPIDCHGAATLLVQRGVDLADASQPIAFCDPAGCVGQPAGAPCDDGSVCTSDDTCDGNGACVPGPPISCAGQCRTGTCDPQVGCLVRQQGASCSDGNACTEGDTCSGGGDTCVPGAPRTCTGPCLTGVCDPAGGCVPRPISTACDDGTACTVGDHCSGSNGQCVSGGALECDDGNPCTVERCDAAAGCMSETLPDNTSCPAVDHCHGPAACIGGACDSGLPLSCDDGDFCTDDLCDPAAGCVYRARSGFPAGSCRIDELRQLVVAGVSERRQGPLLRRLDRVAAALARAEEASGARAQRQLRQADRLLRAFLGSLGKRTDAVTARRLRQSVTAARDAIGTLLASVRNG